MFFYSVWFELFDAVKSWWNVVIGSLALLVIGQAGVWVGAWYCNFHFLVATALTLMTYFVFSYAQWNWFMMSCWASIKEMWSVGLQQLSCCKVVLYLSWWCSNQVLFEQQPLKKNFQSEALPLFGCFSGPQLILVKRTIRRFSAKRNISRCCLTWPILVSADVAFQSWFKALDTENQCTEVRHPVIKAGVVKHIL